MSLSVGWCVMDVSAAGSLAATWTAGEGLGVRRDQKSLFDLSICISLLSSAFLIVPPIII